MKKLVVYKKAEERKKQASLYSCLWNFNPFNYTAEFDDGVGTNGHIDFAVVDSLPTGEYDAVEFVGFSLAEIAGGGKCQE